MDGCSNYNSLEVRRGCRSKKQARDKFAAGDIPHAQGTIFFNPFTAIKFAKEHGFPLVIKPNVSGFSRGSHFPIRNNKELWRAIFLAKLWWPTTVVEQYLQGKNYRVVITKAGVISVLQRYPAFIKGDGINTISALIDMLTTTGFINVDLNDFGKIMNQKGDAILGIGRSDSSDGIEDAVEQALKNPLYKNIDISKAQGAIIQVNCKEEITLAEYNKITGLVNNMLDDQALMICGIAKNEKLDCYVEVLVIGTGLAVSDTTSVIQLTSDDINKETDNASEIKPQKKHEYLNIPAFIRNKGA
jgi:hypothetical protein